MESPAINVNAGGLKSDLKHKWRQLGVVGLDANHHQQQQDDVEKRTVTSTTMPGSGQKVSPACGVQSWVGLGSLVVQSWVGPSFIKAAPGLC